jgi:ATP-dependent protease ClpP protease subunit
MKTPWFHITNTAKPNEPAKVSIYGEIGTGWDGQSGVDAKAFREEFSKIPVNQPVNLHIHSPGGSVFDGLAIYNLIAARRANVTAYVDGVALSAASFIAMAAGKVVMPKTSRMMIHDAQGFSIGDSANMREMATLLDRESDRIADIYASKTGKTRQAMRALMQATTWMDGEEAKQMGFCDECVDAAAVTNSFSLSQFRRVPEELKPTAPTHPAISGAGSTTTPHMDTKNQVAPQATDPQNLAPAIPPATATPQNVIDTSKFVSLEQFQRVENQLKVEREQRVTNRLDAIVAQNPDLARAEWLPRVLADEKILDSLASLKPSIPEPVAAGTIQNFGNPLIESYNKLGPVMAHVRSAADQNHFAVVPSMNLDKANARIKMRKELGGELIRAFDRHTPRNANTVSATIKPDALIDQLVVVANNRLAPLAAFSRLFTVDAMRPGASLQVPKATAGSTGQSNPTSWESGDSTLAPISVTLAHKTQSFQISQTDANFGFGLDHLALVNANAFANLLSDVYTAIMIAGNYGTALLIGAAAAFDSDGLKPVLAAAKNYTNKNLILDGGHLAYLLPTDKFQFALGEAGAYGFDLIAAQNRWTSATTNAVGFVCSPDALAIGAGAPANVSNSQFETYGTFQIAELGLTVLYTIWYNTATRIRWASYEVMFGAAAGDTTQAEVLVSA